MILNLHRPGLAALWWVEMIRKSVSLGASAFVGKGPANSWWVEMIKTSVSLEASAFVGSGSAGCWRAETIKTSVSLELSAVFKGRARRNTRSVNNWKNNHSTTLPEKFFGISSSECPPIRESQLPRTPISMLRKPPRKWCRSEQQISRSTLIPGVRGCDESSWMSSVLKSRSDLQTGG